MILHDDDDTIVLDFRGRTEQVVVYRFRADQVHEAIQWAYADYLRGFLNEKDAAQVLSALWRELERQAYQKEPSLFARLVAWFCGVEARRVSREAEAVVSHE